MNLQLAFFVFLVCVPAVLGLYGNLRSKHEKLGQGGLDESGLLGLKQKPGYCKCPKGKVCSDTGECVPPNELLDDNSALERRLSGYDEGQPCDEDSNCRFDETCVNGKCHMTPSPLSKDHLHQPRRHHHGLEACKQEKCPPGFVCFGGQCVPVVLLEKKSLRHGLCAELKCPPGSVCVGGRCLRKDLLENESLRQGLGGDVDLGLQTCAHGKCPPGFVCVNDQCLPGVADSKLGCRKDHCPPGHSCIAGHCVLQLELPLEQNEDVLSLQGYEECKQGKCPPGYVCVGGQCHLIRRLGTKQLAESPLLGRLLLYERRLYL